MRKRSIPERVREGDTCHVGPTDSGGLTTGPLGPGPQAPELQGPPNSQQTFFVGQNH